MAGCPRDVVPLNYAFSKPLQGMAEFFILDHGSRGLDPPLLRSSERRLARGRHDPGRDRLLAESELRNAGPAEHRIDAFDNLRRQMLQFDRRSAGNRNDKGRARWSRIRVALRPARRPFQLQRAAAASKLPANEIVPARNDLDAGKAARLQGRREHRAHEIAHTMKRLPGKFRPGALGLGKGQSGHEQTQPKRLARAGHALQIDLVEPTEDEKTKSAARQVQGPKAESHADMLLAWYDVHRRRLPWRALANEPADPYAVWISEIMLQQTTVAAVKPYFEKFLGRWPNVEALAAAPVEEVMKAWAGLGYYSRARNLHACARMVSETCGGHFPKSEAALRALPGIGAYTAAAVASIAFGERASVVDGNVERVIVRLFAIEEVMPGARPLIRQHAEALTPDTRPGDYAQAMMDLGATICTPRKPVCALCPLKAGCLGFKSGAPETFPRKGAKTERPGRRGAAFVARRADGAVLVRQRPQKGLLGGMLEVPTTDWSTLLRAKEYAPEKALGLAPLPADWTQADAIEHVFTHFTLRLDVFSAEVGLATPTPAGMRWAAQTTLADEALPTVFRKVLQAASEHPRDRPRNGLKFMKR